MSSTVDPGYQEMKGRSKVKAEKDPYHHGHPHTHGNQMFKNIDPTFSIMKKKKNMSVFKLVGNTFVVMAKGVTLNLN